MVSPVDQIGPVPVYVVGLFIFFMNYDCSLSGSYFLIGSVRWFRVLDLFEPKLNRHNLK